MRPRIRSMILFVLAYERCSRLLVRPVTKMFYPYPNWKMLPTVYAGTSFFIVSPDSKIPPEEVQRFFDGMSQKKQSLRPHW